MLEMICELNETTKQDGMQRLLSYDDQKRGSPIESKGNFDKKYEN